MLNGWSQAAPFDPPPPSFFAHGPGFNFIFETLNMEENNPPHFFTEVTVVNPGSRSSTQNELSHRRAVQILQPPLSASLNRFDLEQGIHVQPPTENVVYEDENWSVTPRSRQIIYCPRRCRKIPRWRRMMRRQIICTIAILVAAILVTFKIASCKIMNVSNHFGF